MGVKNQPYNMAYYPSQQARGFGASPYMNSPYGGFRQSYGRPAFHSRGRYYSRSYTYSDDSTDTYEEKRQQSRSPALWPSSRTPRARAGLPPSLPPRSPPRSLPPRSPPRSLPRSLPRSPPSNL